MKMCKYFDEGWCYHPDVTKPCQCVGFFNCEIYVEIGDVHG